MESNFTQPIDVLENYTKTQFQESYLNPEKPVILRGLWKNYKASTLWTPEYFSSLLKNTPVGVFDGKLSKPDRSFKKPDYFMGFDEYMEKITANEPHDLRLFLFDILKLRPQLRTHFDYPDLTRFYLKNIPFMFFGGKGSVVRLHQDMDWSNVFLTQLHGKKEVFLFSPKYSKLLYKYPFNVHSPVNVEYPDYDEYPALKYVKGYHAILQPGDTLFMPSGYWHYIKYLEGGYAINQRALSTKPKNLLNGLVNIVFKTHFDELMRNILHEDWFDYKTRKMRQNANEELQKVNWA